MINETELLRMALVTARAQVAEIEERIQLREMTEPPAEAVEKVYKFLMGDLPKLPPVEEVANACQPARRQFSAAGRAAISRAQTARWKEYRKSKGK